MVNPGAIDAAFHHVWLQEASFEIDVMIGQGLELRSQDFLGHLRTIINVMISIRNDFRLDDGHQPLALADGSVARKRVNSVSDRQVARQALRGIKLKNVAPLGKARTIL